MATATFVKSNASTGRSFNETALQKLLAAAPGVTGCYMPDTTWAPLLGGRRYLINRIRPAQRFAAPQAGNSPALLADDANGYGALSFNAAAQNHLAPGAKASMGLSKASGWLLFVSAWTSQSTCYVIANQDHVAVGDRVPNFSYVYSNPNEYIRLLTGNAAPRVQEASPVTDLGSAYHLFLWAWGPNGFSLSIDGNVKTPSVVDVNGFDWGEFEIGRRATTFASMKLALLMHGTVDFALPGYDASRTQLITQLRASLGTP